jgi:hypothetical protein
MDRVLRLYLAVSIPVAATRLRRGGHSGAAFVLVATPLAAYVVCRDFIPHLTTVQAVRLSCGLPPAGRSIS